jgi:transcriptional regulator with XRE-family HTH domain
MITPLQVRMARAALGWGVRELGMEAGISANTVSRFETGGASLVETLTQMQSALEKAGIVFIPADEHGGPGVRLRDAPRTNAKRKRR